MTRWSRFRRLFGLEPKADVEEELSFHLEMRTRELVERGETPGRARDLALRRFGDYESSRHECVVINERRRRYMTRAAYLIELRQDVGYALRMLRRTPGFTAVAVATLALGIAANTAIFSVVHAVLLQSLPFRSAERLYEIRTLYPDGTAYDALSAPDFMSVREESRVFEQVEAYTTHTFTLLGLGEPQEVRGASVGDGLFDLLGVTITHGRGFVLEEHEPGRGRVAVLDHGFWQRSFGGDRGVLGRTVSLNGDSYAIVGVLRPGARLPDAALDEIDLYVPLEYDETFSAATATARRSEYLDVLGRAKAGVVAEQVDRDLGRIGTQLQARFPETNEVQTFNGRSLPDLIVGDVRTPLLVLLGAVGFVLLVACANVANLLLARASARQSELAVRAALGAGRSRLLRQLLTEAVVLGLVGGALGMALAYGGTKALVAAQPADIPRLEEVGVNGTVLIFTLTVALLTSLLFGLLPALQATRHRLAQALRDGGRGGDATSGGHRIRSTLIVAEIALAVVLLTGAGLLIRSFVELTRVDAGFQPDRAVAFRVALQGDAYEETQAARLRVAELEDRLRAMRGVSDVAATTTLPLSGRGSLIDFRVVGAPPPPPNVNREVGITSITPGYFQAIGTPLTRGRLFTDRDHDEAPLVAVVNEAAVGGWFPDRDPIGQRVSMSGERYEIVGVVEDVLQEHPGQAALPQLFVPYAQRTTRSVRIVLRGAGDLLALVPSIRVEVRSLDRNLAIADVTPLRELLTGSMTRPRFYTALLALFAGVALALAAIGIFGVTSYAVAQRTREIGVRMALGAAAGNVVGMIVGRAFALAGVGTLLGLGAALALGRVIQSQLFGVTLFDPVTLGVVALLLIASALVASLWPARRAARLDPSRALRES